MYTTNSSLIIVVLCSFGTALQLAGFITPGWIIYNSDPLYNDGVNFQAAGLWFKIECKITSGCNAISYYYMSKNGDMDSIQYKGIVGNEVCATLSVVFSILPCALGLLSLVRPRKSFYAGLVSVLSIFISASFIWPLIGSFAVQQTEFSTKFPYALFLSAFGSAVVLLVGIAHIVFICRILQRREVPLIQDE